MKNDDYLILGAMFLWAIYIALKDYKRTRNLWQILEKINWAGKDFYFDVVVKKNDDWKFKRIKVSKEVFDKYNRKDWIAI